MTTAASKLPRVALAAALGLTVGIPVAVSAQANDDGVLVGQFEIDGNYYAGLDNDSTADNAIDPIGIDWGSVEGDENFVNFVDQFQPDDMTIFSQGSAENDPVEDWDDDSNAQAGGSADMRNVWVYDEVFEGDQYVYIAWERQTDQGTVGWFVELNQEPNVINGNGVSVPDRTVGDLRITLENQGGGPIEAVRIEQWDGDDWVDAPTAEIEGDSNDSPIFVPGGGTLGTELFNEFGFNLTDIFGDEEDCLFTGFAQLNLRSAASSQQNSALKDYANVPIDIEPRCGDILIEKRDTEGNLIGPVTFEITPDPTPGSQEESLIVTDNEPPDTNDTLGVIEIGPSEPGDYTITEITPPPGYIQLTDPHDVTLEEYGSVTVVFENRLGTVAWEKVDATSGDPICCATFEVEGVSGEALAQEVFFEVTDNSEPDLDPDPGVIMLEDLVTGAYMVTETVPPTGYDLPDDPTQHFEISAETPDVVLATAFEDPRLLSELTVLKVDADDGAELAGATFALYRDTDGDGEDGVTDEAPDPDDELIGDCTSADDGTCTIGELDFGTYYWFEVEAPDGYLLPGDRTSEMVTITAENAGTALTVVVFEDVREDVPPSPTPEPTEPPKPPEEPKQPEEPEQPKLPDTGVSLAGASLVAMGALLAGAGLAAIRRRQGAVE